MDIFWSHDTILSQWCLTLFTFFIVYLTTSVVYNIYFHPLSKYPGPFFAKISTLPSFYYALVGYRHIWIWQCHEIYGEKVRIHPNGILINSASAYRAIYGHKANVKRGDFYYITARKTHIASTLSTVDKDKHARKRRILNRVFSDTAIRSAEGFIVKHVDRWCDLLVDNDSKDWSPPKNAATLLQGLIFDIIGDLAVGKSFDIKEPVENPLKAVPAILTAFVKLVYPISRSPFVKSWVWLKPRGLNALIELLRPKNVRQFHEFVEKTVSERRQLEEISSQSDSHEENSRKDMFHYLYHAQDFDTGQPAYTADDVLAEASVLLIAGTETTVTSLCSFFFYITRNPRVYEKLLGEIRDTFGALGEICGRKLTSCKYLHACIDEALRLTPAIPSELPRTVLKGDFEIDGEIFPEGTLIGTAAWSLLHNEDYFEDPWVYRPERWIIEESTGVSEADVARAQAAFNPFSIGPGNCVGQRLATVEMLVCIARTLYQYDVRSVPGDDLGSGSPKSRWGMRAVRNFQVKDGYTAQRDGPMVEFRRRA